MSDTTATWSCRALGLLPLKVSSCHVVAYDQQCRKPYFKRTCPDHKLTCLRHLPSLAISFQSLRCLSAAGRQADLISCVQFQKPPFCVKAFSRDKPLAFVQIRRLAHHSGIRRLLDPRSNIDSTTQAEKCPVYTHGLCKSKKEPHLVTFPCSRSTASLAAEEPKLVRIASDTPVPHLPAS